MYERLRHWALFLLKVPPEPHPPSGDPASLRVFRAGRNYFRLRLAGWSVAQILALGAILFWTAMLAVVETTIRTQRPGAVTVPAAPGVTAASSTAPSGANKKGKDWPERFADTVRSAAQAGEKEAGAAKESNPMTRWMAGFKQVLVEFARLVPTWAFPLIWALKIVGFLIYLLQIPVTYAVLRLDYEMRWYMVTDRSLRLRHGVWRLSEATMSFANIQQVVVSQGPLQRLLGIANVKVKSAGGGSGQHSHGGESDDMHSGFFHSVNNAPEIRDLILARLRRFRESGLGDPEEKPAMSAASPAPAQADALAAAQELLAEARALRAAL